MAADGQTAARRPATRLAATAGGVALAGLTVALVSAALELALTKSFSVDEFAYAHGSWLIARGEIIYRDFFDPHFPLLHQLLALVWLRLDDHPVNLLVLRVAVLPALLGIAAAAGLANRGHGRLTAWITPAVVLSTSFLVGMGVEIRPDTLGFALFLAAVAVLAGRGRRAAGRGFAAGLLVGLALWASQKVVYYGVVAAAALAADVLVHRRRDGGQLTGDWRAFLAGAATVAAAAAGYLTVTGSWAAWARWTLVWVAEHQRLYPGFPWTQSFLPLLAYHSLLFGLGAVGFAATLRRLARQRRPADPDWLLAGLAVTTLVAAAWQSAAYAYSFVPFAAVAALFAARGTVDLYRALGRARRERPGLAVFGLALVSLLLAGELAHVRTLYGLPRNDNAAQLDTLRRLGELTAPGDPVFDISGQRITRPGVFFFFFTDAVIRSQQAGALAREVPANIVARGCTAYLHDDRWPSLPPELRRFLLTWFQPVTDELWLWGRRYRVGSGGELEDRFVAVRDGTYFVHPASAVARGRLTVGGEPVPAAELRLAAGEHRLRYEGPPGELALLWLPRDGRRWVPRPHPAGLTPAAAPR